jgi:hypothetical protein
MIRLLWRYIGRPLTVLAFRLGFRLGLVPSVGVAWALRRLVGGIDVRWPALRPWWALRGLAVVVVVVPSALLWLHSQGYATPTFAFKWGWLVLGLYVVLGLVLATSWPGVPNVVRWLWKGFGDGRKGGQRTTDNAPGSQRETTPAKIRPVSAQRVATDNYGELVWGVQAIGGPGELTMLCGASGMGKSELKWGLWRAQFDGEDFCGLKTTKGKRKLLLTEMSPKTTQKALKRWGFVVDPNGRLDALRQRYWTRKGSAGGYIDVVYAADVYAVDEDGGSTDWQKVLLAVRERALRGGYDEVVIDTFAEWAGADNNDNAVQALKLCRQLTNKGLAVTILHHTPMSDPTRPRGGGGIVGGLDIGWAIHGTGPKYAKRALHDPVRVLTCFKSRHQDVTPAEPLTIEYLPGSPGERPRYRLAGSQPARATVTEVPRTAPTLPTPTPGPGTPGRKLLDAMKAHGGPATLKELGTGLDRTSAYATMKELVAAGLVNEAGTVPTPGGGKPSMRYVVASQAAQERSA